MDKLVEGLLWYGVFLFSTTVHEGAHAFTSRRFGDKTGYEGGHAILDPVPLIRREPVGTVLFPLLSFFSRGWMIGWASAPYDPLWAMRFPKRSAMMSLAGPMANLALVLVSCALIRLGVLLDVFCPPDSINLTHITAAARTGFFDGAATFVSILFSLNLILCFFNLLPLPPLDGSGIIPAALGEDTTRRYMDAIQDQTWAIIGLFLAWRLFHHIFYPIHLLAINLLYYPGAWYR